MSATVVSGWHTHELGKCTGAVAYLCSSRPYLLKTDGCVQTYMRTVSLTTVSCEREFYVKIQAVRAKVQTNRVITHSSPSTWERRQTRRERAAGKETQRQHITGIAEQIWLILKTHTITNTTQFSVWMSGGHLCHSCYRRTKNCKSEIIFTQFLQGKHIYDRLV